VTSGRAYDCASSTSTVIDFSFRWDMQTLGRKASDLGVMLGIEVLNRYETNVCNTAVQGMELVTDIDEPSVCVHLDSYHMNIEEFSMGSAVRACSTKLGCGLSPRQPNVSNSGDTLCIFVLLDNSVTRSPCPPCVRTAHICNDQSTLHPVINMLLTLLVHALPRVS
jgi:hypothetical protein